MSIDIAAMDRLTQKFELAADGKWYARTYSGPTVVAQDEITGFTSGALPSEVQDVLAAQRIGIALGGTSLVATKVNPLTGGSTISAADSTLKLPAGVTDLSGGVGSGGVASESLDVLVSDFAVDNFRFGGGKCPVLPNGTWFVGVDMLTTKLIALPRLGHRGWVPVARAISDATKVTSLEAIEPKVPTCRIPRTMKKILNKQPISVVVMGSSLTAGGSTTDWPGMLLRSDSDPSKYKIPGAISAIYSGVGASPNQYQLAQLGFASSHSSYGFPNSGSSGAITDKKPPNGRSAMFSGVDLVILGCLANGGEYRLENIEPIVRKLRAAGVEVIMTTDNPQGPTSAYSTMNTAGLYVDGPEVMRIADLYGVEVADTAAYVFEAHLRYGAGIYGDSIHMAGGVPAGRNAAPACGHEVWARAIRSIITADALPGDPVSLSYDFASGSHGFIQYSDATISTASGSLAVTKASSNVNQWGSWITSLPQINNGDTVRVRGVASGTAGANLSIGLQFAGWASNSVGVGDGAFDVTLTATHDSTALLFYGGNNSAASGTTFSVDNLIIDITHVVGRLSDNTPGRKQESMPLPPIRVVTDYKTPADAFIILPSDEHFVTGNNPYKGAVSPHPWGASSFARRWNETVHANQDLLVLATGKRACLGANGVVGWSLLHYRDQNDGACTFDIYRNDIFVKTVNISNPPFGNEWYTTLFTPTELNRTGPTEPDDSIDIRVTSGTLKVAALIALTADIDYVLPEQITFVGNWLPKEISRSGLAGRPTDTSGDYAVLFCHGRRVQWIISGNPGSKMLDAYSDREVVVNQNWGGNYHIYSAGGLFGPSCNHIIKCVQPNPAGNQANGHALHIGGAIIINDR